MRHFVSSLSCTATEGEKTEQDLLSPTACTRDVPFQHFGKSLALHVGSRPAMKYYEIPFQFREMLVEPGIIIIKSTLISLQGIPSSSAGEECACNAGDPGSVPGSGRLLEKG